jgi:GntR family transcriptional regulator
LLARPLYLQLRDALAERVATGQWKPGGAIPNESELAREFGVSAGTMRKALDLMEAEHLVTRRQGRGTFVNDQTTDALAVRFCNIRALDGRRVAGQFRDEEIVAGEANGAECERLSLAENDRVYRIHRLRTDKDRTFMVEDICLPAALFAQLSNNDIAATQIVTLAQRHGILLGRAGGGELSALGQGPDSEHVR